MEFNLLFSSAQPPFFINGEHINMSNPNYFQDNGLMDIQTSWIENIDPLLRTSNQQPSWQLQQRQQQQLQQQQQRPLQRFINAPERALFTAPSYSQYPQTIQRSVGTPISTLPHVASHARMVSPSPSQDHLSSTCSSARSPAPEQDLSYYSPSQPHDDFYLPNDGGNAQAFYDQWPASQPSYPTNYHVNMSQIQPFPDPQETMYETDEGLFMESQDMQKSSDYPTEIHSLEMSASGSQHSYRYASDEGLGPSIKDASSPPAEDEDLGGEGEAEAEEEEDAEYMPRSTRSRKRRASYSQTPPQPSTKRSRPNKALPKSKSPNGNLLICKTCNLSDFKDGGALARHVASAHTRPYICVFDFAGCHSTFASKNEWKRHVSSQHLNLHSWICAQGQCAKVAHGRGSEFNRKDLFTQHLRRMHAPASTKHARSSNSSKRIPEWEDELRDLQASCLNIKRLPPTKLACPVKGCGTVFEGHNCWDDRMEHVGKHLEKVVPGSGKVGVVQGDDGFLVAWAVREGIVVRKGQHAAGFRFAKEGEFVGRGGGGGGGGGGGSVGFDEDADCEEEY